jgi:hypothetical protein
MRYLSIYSGFQCGWPTQHDACITLFGWCVQPLAYARRAWVNATATRCRTRKRRVRPRTKTERGIVRRKRLRSHRKLRKLRRSLEEEQGDVHSKRWYGEARPLA